MKLFNSKTEVSAEAVMIDHTRRFLGINTTQRYYCYKTVQCSSFQKSGMCKKVNKHQNSEVLRKNTWNIWMPRKVSPNVREASTSFLSCRKKWDQIFIRWRSSQIWYSRITRNPMSWMKGSLRQMKNWQCNNISMPVLVQLYQNWNWNIDFCRSNTLNIQESKTLSSVSSSFSLKCNPIQYSRYVQLSD